LQTARDARRLQAGHETFQVSFLLGCKLSGHEWRTSSYSAGTREGMAADGASTGAAGL
jgi:hypothetical protein